jgi:ceramide glucosyltransferase
VTVGAAIRWALLLLALAPFGYYIVAIIAARRFFRARPSGACDFTPPVSLLKPIYGLDREAYENYASFCRQDYPEFEILFCVSDPQDPAVPMIGKLMDDFPERSIRLLIGADHLGVNDKVNKLCQMARQSRHEVVIVSDSDVRVEPGFLRAVVAPFSNPKVGGVTCLYRGLTDGSLAADLEAAGNSTDFAAGVLVAWLLGKVDFMLGAVMATTKQHLAEIGGFESLVDYFSDDYELGNRIAGRGHRIELSTFPVSIVYPQETLHDAFRHQVRWNLSIRHSRPGGHLGLIFTQGFAWSLVGFALAPSLLGSFAYLAAYLLLSGEMVRAIGIYGMQDLSLRKKDGALLLRGPFAFIVWLASFFPQRIRWREQEFHVREKRLVAVGTRRAP